MNGNLLKILISIIVSVGAIGEAICEIIEWFDNRRR